MAAEVGPGRQCHGSAHREQLGGLAGSELGPGPVSAVAGLCGKDSCAGTSPLVHLGLLSVWQGNF